jgi:hypothetical protein
MVLLAILETSRKLFNSEKMKNIHVILDKVSKTWRMIIIFNTEYEGCQAVDYLNACFTFNIGVHV